LSGAPEVKQTLAEALNDIRSGHVVSEQPVDVKLLHGASGAERLDAAEWG
jgi:hypothetical protein